MYNLRALNTNLSYILFSYEKKQNKNYIRAFQSMEHLNIFFIVQIWIDLIQL